MHARMYTCAHTICTEYMHLEVSPVRVGLDVLPPFTRPASESLPMVDNEQCIDQSLELGDLVKCCLDLGVATDLPKRPAACL